uniref:Uncharacterized protein n=1 Tax=Sphaerodactylus townsendi TaxID=933632 RepID=A0ACB8ETR4_9SAUR
MKKQQAGKRVAQFSKGQFSGRIPQSVAMYEAKARQKFISDAQYLREMQHKMDTEYQACLRKQEQTREQSEKKREQHARQEMRQTSISSISSVRSYERPWISRLPVNRQISSEEVCGCESKSSMKSPGNKPEAKFPAIDKIPVKQKQKAGTWSKKTEKSGTSPKKASGNSAQIQAEFKWSESSQIHIYLNA